MELENIANVKLNIISPGISKPIIGIIQDGLLGAYNLTQPDMKIRWKDAMNIMSYTNSGNTFPISKGKEYFGTELFSNIIPDNINVNKKHLVVKDGVLDNKKGVLNKSMLGAKKQNSLVHLIWDEYGADDVQDFLNDTQRLINNFNMVNGFSVGMRDLIIDSKVKKIINKLTETTKLEVETMITQMENNPNLLDSDIFEMELQNKLNQTFGEASKLVMNDLKKDNNFRIMNKAGSKGSDINMAQMVAFLGQQAVEGARIKKKLNGRTLPYVFQNDDRAIARGFVERPYLGGISLVEFIFHNMGSREGLIDTAIKTSESGYIQRKLIKALEDVMVKYDCTIRDANENIIQFVSSGHGIDYTKQTEHVIDLIKMGNTEIAQKYTFTKDELKKVSKYDKKDNDRYLKKLQDYRDLLRETQVRRTQNYLTLDPMYMLPVNFHRIISNSISQDKGNKTKLEPKYILDKLEDILDYKNTQLLCLRDVDIKNPNSIKYKDEKAAKLTTEIALHYFLNPKRCIFEYGLNKVQFDNIVEKIIEGFNNSVVEPGEMVGIISAQSIGEPVTQLTLNSIDWEDKIIIKVNGNTKIVKIGEYIDQKEKDGNNVKYIGDNHEEEMGNTVYIDTSKEDIFAPSVNEDGNIEWKKVNALTKHLPINKDGTDTLISIKTRMGCEVKATKAKSFLTRKDNKIIATRGDKLDIGMYLPIMKDYPKMKKYKNHIDMEQYFPKNEYIHGSEIKKALNFRSKRIQEGGSKANWFKGHNGQVYTVPYKRSDSLWEVAKGHRNKKIYKEGIIYPKNGHSSKTEIPNKLPLDNNFGFFVGAYLAEGLSTNTYIAISNNDSLYRQKIKDFCDKYSIGYHITKQKDKIQDGWTSTDVRIHSTMLAKFMKDICNTGSKNKIVPEFAYDSNDDFVKGLLDGYLSGDGTVSVSRRYILATSISKDLLTGISLLLSRFGILNKQSTPTKIEKNNRGSKNINQHYTLSIRNNNLHRFKENISLTIKDKQNKLDELYNIEFQKDNGKFDIIPGNNISSLKGNFHRDEIRKIYENDKSINNKDKDILKKIINSDVYYDEIISLEEVKPTHKYVYDLTVEDNKTFTLFNGLTCYDTFHSAGIASKGTSTLGTVRMKECLGLSKNMKTPRMMLYLMEGVRANHTIVKKIASHLRLTTIMDVRKNIDIYFDPIPLHKNSFMAKDNVKNVFYSYNPSRLSCQEDVNKFPLLVRIVFDKEKLMEKEVSLLDVKSKFCNYWDKRFKEMKGSRREEKQLLENITGCAVLSNNDNDEVPIIHIRFEMNDYSINSMRNFVDIIIDPLKLKGINNITDIDAINNMKTIAYSKDKSIINEEEYMIQTVGVNMIDIRYINNIDINKTITNNIIEVYETFGIEAARTSLVREFKNIFTGGGAQFNYQHLYLLADLITHKGMMVSIDRHGMKKTDKDPLAKCSFEKTVDQLQEAAFFGLTDSMRSVSSRIMTGQCIKGGTGACDVVLDIDMIENSEYLEDVIPEYEEAFNNLTVNSMFNDILTGNDIKGFVPT